MIVLVTGGSGCGKSYYAERLVARLAAKQGLVYVATMEAMDDECRARIARHRSQREPLGFATMECPTGLDRLDIAAGASVILECVPTLLANEMFSPGGDSDAVLRGIEKLALRCANLVVVTNDVFADGARYDPETEAYRARLGVINCAIAARADCVVEVVYTVPVLIKGCLD